MADNKCSRLPGLRKEVRAQIEEYTNRLSSLPPRPSQPPAIALLQLITRYMADLDSLVQGGPDKRYMIQRCTAAYDRFRLAVRDTAPVFVPKTRRQSGAGRGETIENDSGDSDAEHDASK